MLIRELLESTEFELANQEQAAGEAYDELTNFLGTIDTKSDPVQLVTRLEQLQSEYPMIDQILDLFPQTRLIKNVAFALDSIVAGRPQDALSHLGRALGGRVGTVAQLARAGSEFRQGDTKSAAITALGATPLGQQLNRGRSLADRASSAVLALNDPKQAVQRVRDRVLPQQEPAPIDDRSPEPAPPAQAPRSAEDLPYWAERERLRRLSGQS